MVLKGIRVYLSGAIEYDPQGTVWRGPVKKVLREEFGLKVFDPLADPKQEIAKTIEDYRKNKQYDELRRLAKFFVKKDLGIVDRSDIIIAHVPRALPTVGTIHEIVVSDQSKKPTLLVCPQGKEMAGFWFYGIIPLGHIFGSWEDLFVHLREVNLGLHKEDPRWGFVYHMSDYEQED